MDYLPKKQLLKLNYCTSLLSTNKTDTYETHSIFCPRTFCDDSPYHLCLVAGGRGYQL